ncbi:acetylaminoadipate kinase [Sulfolobus acidocaldarius SUSAZ]|nr:acetylaminoadipate kinase [Sulfolobus acidocaldarius SUSAZ]
MIVVKTGGRVLKQNLDRVVQSIIKTNDKIIYVHGGGDQVTELSSKLGIEPKFVTSPEGIRSRYTTKEELEVFIMVMSSISRNILSKVSSYRNSIALTGADGKLVLAERKKKIIIIDERGRKRIVDGGYTGKIKNINKELLVTFSNLFEVIILSPLAYDPDESTLLNVDGDQMAFALATALRSDNLILLTDVEGVMVDNKVVNKLTVEEAKELSKKIGPGMNRKILMAAEAIENGVKKVIISSGLVEDPIKNALEGKGTVIE